jgi:hypothetical protein
VVKIGRIRQTGSKVAFDVRFSPWKKEAKNRCFHWRGAGRKKDRLSIKTFRIFLVQNSIVNTKLNKQTNRPISPPSNSLTHHNYSRPARTRNPQIKYWVVNHSATSKRRHGPPFLLYVVSQSYNKSFSKQTLNTDPATTFRRTRGEPNNILSFFFLLFFLPFTKAVTQYC